MDLTACGEGVGWRGDCAGSRRRREIVMLSSRRSAVCGGAAPRSRPAQPHITSGGPRP